MTESATGVSATSEVVALVPRKSEKWTAIGFLLGLVGSARMQYHRSQAFFSSRHMREGVNGKSLSFHMKP